MSTQLHEWVALHAARRPEAVAIVSEHESLTYAQLDRRANQFARLLREFGCARGDRVCLLAPSSATVIAAILGVLRADAVYVPHDPATPATRLARLSSWA